MYNISKEFEDGYWAATRDIPFDSNQSEDWKQGYREAEENLVGMDLQNVFKR